MSTNKTPNYQLSQWLATDPIRMSDFNADNQIIDSALKAEADAREALTETITKCGNCKIVTGTYTGTGTYGSGNPNTLTFDGKPLLLAILPNTNMGNAAHNFMAVRGSGMVFTYAGYFQSQCTVTWGEKSVTWYNSDNADYQFNRNYTTFYYVALLAADE